MFACYDCLDIIYPLFKITTFPPLFYIRPVSQYTQVAKAGESIFELLSFPLLDGISITAIRYYSNIGPVEWNPNQNHCILLWLKVSGTKTNSSTWPNKKEAPRTLLTWQDEALDLPKLFSKLDTLRWRQIRAPKVSEIFSTFTKCDQIFFTFWR